MDPNILNFFAVPNNQTLNNVDQNNQSSQQQQNPSPWGPPDLESGMGASRNQGGSSFNYQPTATSDISFSQAPMQSTYTGPNNASLPNRGHPRNHPQQQRRREGHAHDRKRTKVDTDSALESLDYWIRFDDEEAERTGSYEIDFSKRYDPMNSNANTHYRPGYGSSSNTPGLGTGVYASSLPFQGAEYFDDNALDNALSDEEEEGIDSMSLEEHLSKIETMPPPEVPPREGLYSTPLSWEKPEPGLRVEPDLGMGNTQGAMNFGFGQNMSSMGNNQVLSNEEQRRLLAIAMNTGRTTSSFMPATGFGLGFGAGLGTGMSDFNSNIESLLGTPTGGRSQKQTPTPTNSSKAPSRNQDIKTENSSETGLSSTRPGLSRTSTATSDVKGKEKLKGGDRTAHNDIERKYRTNLKDKISELRDAVPALHSIPEDGENNEAEGDSQRAPKVSKGTVLTKATEYIQHLERRNRAIMKEHQELARRLQAFEQLLSASARQPFLMPNHSRTLFDPRGFC
ncbi:hypothetical protein FPOA_11494 [Fusarium poae]|uniref:BHLH domain-containing protein n=1 Tax=Fusarium poae TaxID=36050 RepID=A0A1B8AGZ9_FUSPO|nr:hypothetical protein FPOA_11494 [Fusarium poae]